MKPTLSTIALAALVAFASLIQAHAQTTDVSRMNVPFGFNWGTDHFPAGTYQIGIYEGGYLVLTDSKGHMSFGLAQLGAEPSSSAKSAYVAFRKYGNTYFLAEYQSRGGMAMSLGESKRERAVARDFASNPPDTGRVRLALLKDGPIR